MIAHLALFAASYVYVFLKAFQQRAVAADNFLPILPISLGLATLEVFSIATVAAAGFAVGNVLAVGFGAGLGAMSAMLVYRRMYHRRR